MAKYRFMSIARVEREILEWRPRGCRTELQYRDSLYKKLDGAFKQVPTKEYGVGRVRADIAYDTEICIELKFNFNSTGKYHRLLGQLDDYTDTFEHVIVVLTGKTDDELYNNLKKKSKGVTIIAK